MTTLTVQELREALAGLHPTDKVVVDVREATGRIFKYDPPEELGIHSVERTPSTYGFHAIIRCEKSE